MSVIEDAVQWAICIANDQSHGYSQASRWGKPDYDCSSFAISAYKAAGVPIDTSVVNYTGNYTNLLRFGFKDVTKKCNFSTRAGLKRGDILWYHKSGNIGHVAIYIGNGQIVHARGQRYGSSKPGDQGSEIAVASYYPQNWQHVYRYVGGAATTAQESNKTTSAAPASAYRYTVTASLPLIRIGSTGLAVRVWQQILGITVDGDYGVKTNNATVQWQKANGLESDGEVGGKTWAKALNNF
jgi:hypothetical protein